MSETFTELEIKLIKDELVKGENTHQIYLKLNSMGCTVSRKTVYNYIRKLKTEDPLFKIDKQRARTDLFYHNRYVMNFDKMIDIHKEWGEWWKEFLASDKQVGLFLVPRDCFKSTFFTIGASTQLIGNDPNVRILLTNAVVEKVKEFLGVIGLNIRANPKYAYVYGDLYGHHLSGRRRDWTTMKIRVVRDSMILADPTVSIAGVGSAVAGKHVEYIFWDDLNEFTNVQTEMTRQKVIDFWKLSNALLVPGGKGLIIMTRWHDGDLAGWVTDNIPGDVMVFWRGCRNTGGKKYFPKELKSLNAEPKDKDKELYFPERLSQEILDVKKRKLGSYLYNCQYENNPLPEETKIFKEKYFKYKKTYFKNPFTYFLIDPAYTKKIDSANTGFIILTTSSSEQTKANGEKWIRQETMINRAYKKQVNPSELLDMIFRLAHKWNPLVIGIEEGAFEKALKVAIDQRQTMENFYINVEPMKIPQGVSKKARIRGLEPFYEDNLREDGNRLFHYKNVGEKGTYNYCEDLERELLRFPIGKKKDLMDALANFPDFVIYPSPEQAETQGMHPLIKKLLQRNRLRNIKFLGNKWVKPRW